MNITSLIKYKIILLFFLHNISLRSQVDYSDNWEEYYSYNNVKNIVENDNILYAMVDNAVFIYNPVSGDFDKLSSINGLSGKTTSSIHYSAENSTLIIGYQNGLMEVIKNNHIKRIADIIISDISPEKQIKSIYEHDNKIYLSMQFGIVIYDLNTREFVDTFFIGVNSSAVVINDVLIKDGYIYAASNNGIYTADMTSNLNNSENWSLNFSERFDAFKIFKERILVSKENKIYEIANRSSLELKLSMPSKIKDFDSDESNLIVTTSKEAKVFNHDFNPIKTITGTGSNINSVLIKGALVYLGTSSKGILSRRISNSDDFVKLLPEGPVKNGVFSISVKDNNLWIVYGGYNSIFNFLRRREEVTHYNGESWVHIPYSSSLESLDLVDVAIDPNHENRVYISSFAKGVMVIENDEPLIMLNNSNSNLGVWEAVESLSLITYSKFDNQGALWVANSWGKDNKLLYKLENNTAVFDVNFSPIVEIGKGGDRRIYEIEIDHLNNIWMASFREGLFVTNGKMGDELKIQKLSKNNGNLPSNTITSIAVDKNNKIWIGTDHGLVVFDDIENVFENSFREAAPVIIIDDGTPKKLLGSSKINDIHIDGANNKWFGTETGGIIQTNSSGKTTLLNFNTENSPLPSNTILKIQMNESTGKMFFATSKGIVAYKSKILPYGESLKEVYAYPNPALKAHNNIHIVGRNGKNLPPNTNVKIIDVAGNLVFETNTIERNSNFGGQIIWDKTNLKGNKVASGVYIILLFNGEGKQSASTKIAIIN